MTRFTSLDELPPTVEKRFSVGWQFASSSSFDDHAMELNTPHMAHTLRAYGFGGLVVQSYNGDSISYGVDGVAIEDFNLDGSMSGSATGPAARAERASVSIDPGSDYMLSHCNWPTATVRINRTELADRVASRIEAGVDQWRAQTNELDEALRVGLWNAGLKKARGDINTFGLAFSSGAAYFQGAEVIAHNVAGLAIAMGLVQASSLGATAVLGRNPRTGATLREKRFSLFPVEFQPDRILLGAAMTAMRFIRYNFKKEQPPQEW